MILRKGTSPTRPCTNCGVGVWNAIRLCRACGYDRIDSKLRMRRMRAFKKEFNRLAAIDITI